MLQKERDPLGHSVMDYYTAGKADTLSVHSNVSEPDEIPVSWLFRDYNQMPKIEQRALDLCRGAVLDIGAAAGAHSLELMQRGISVTPIDISPLSVEVMKNRGLPNAGCEDFYTLSENNKFDTLLFMMNGAGIAGDMKGLKPFLEKCRYLLEPGGQILLDSSDIKYLYDSEDEYPSFYYGEVTYRMVYKNILSDPFKWLFIDYKRLKESAETLGFRCSKIVRGSEGSYLARLISVRKNHDHKKVL